jgi:hypothetical protein
MNLDLAKRYLCTQLGVQHFKQTFEIICIDTPLVWAQKVGESFLQVGESIAPIEEVNQGVGFLKVYVYPRTDDKEGKPAVRFIKKGDIGRLLPLPLPTP